MLFSSIVFLFYFLPIVLILYYIFRFSVPIKNGILLVFSLFFYAWGEPVYILIMLCSIGINYSFAVLIDKYRKKEQMKKRLLVMVVFLNLSILFIFKYLNFAMDTINNVAALQLKLPNITLPIGISFFTFQALSYVIDVYRGNVKVQKNLFYLALYISLFPQLIAGPIIQYASVAEQIYDRKETWNKFSLGVCRFITGMGKKVLLANSFAVIADQIFRMNASGNQPVTLAWIGAIAYTLQILFDFSGYSDMAIGLGLMFGFKFTENFNYPYISKSISEFWRRWHITLGSWFREYVYFPLGGSRVKNKDLIIRNLFIVWLLTGVWHGANWTFVIWGLMNFVAIVFERFTNFEYIKGHNVIRWFYAMLLVTMGWVVFRSDNLVDAGNYYASMFGLNQNGFLSSYAWMFLRENAIFFVAGVLLCIPFGKRVNQWIAQKQAGFMKNVIDVAYPPAMMGLFLICVVYLVKGTYNPFIYFNF